MGKISKLSLQTKVENQGQSSEGRFYAWEFNAIVRKINEIIDSAGVSDNPEKDGEEAFSTNGAYKYIPTQIIVSNTTEGIADFLLVNAEGTPIGSVQSLAFGDSTSGSNTNGRSVSSGESMIINLNAHDRDTVYTLESALAAIDNPPYGAILMFVNSSDQWSMWQFTGRDYTSELDWEPMVVS